MPSNTVLAYSSDSIDTDAWVDGAKEVSSGMRRREKVCVGGEGGYCYVINPGA